MRPENSSQSSEFSGPKNPLGFLRKYKTFPYTNGFCLPSCLQSVLDRRGFSVPRQEEISLYFGEGDGNFGLNLIVTEQDLNTFLRRYNLRAKHEIPEANTDLTIKSALSNNFDILVAYSFSHLFKTQKPALHVSLVADFNEGVEKEILLFDSGFQDSFLRRASLPDLIQSMIATESANSGFYLIN